MAVLGELGMAMMSRAELNALLFSTADFMSAWDSGKIVADDLPAAMGVVLDPPAVVVTAILIEPSVVADAVAHVVSAR